MRFQKFRKRKRAAPCQRLYLKGGRLVAIASESFKKLLSVISEMMKRVLLILAFGLVLMALGILIYLQSSAPVNTATQNYRLVGDYFIYDNIPAGLRFANPQESIPNDAPVVRWNETDAYFETTALVARSTDVAFPFDVTKHRCRNIRKEPESFTYFVYNCRREVEGCGHTRKAIICGDQLFIEDTTMSRGPRLYGPFERLLS